MKNEEILKQPFTKKLEEIEEGMNLDIYKTDTDIEIIKELMSRQLFLDEFLYHPNPNIRILLTKLDYGLDILSNDPIPAIRMAVARRHYGLEKLAKDPDWMVRMTVAQQGYKPTQMIKDEHICVRQAVYELMLQAQNL